eukprot:6718420-Pyramimonas_sp.AAC.1
MCIRDSACRPVSSPPTRSPEASGCGRKGQRHPKASPLRPSQIEGAARRAHPPPGALALLTRPSPPGPPP